MYHESFAQRRSNSPLHQKYFLSKEILREIFQIIEVRGLHGLYICFCPRMKQSNFNLPASKNKLHTFRHVDESPLEPLDSSLQIFTPTECLPSGTCSALTCRRLSPPANITCTCDRAMGRRTEPLNRRSYLMKSRFGALAVFFSQRIDILLFCQSPTLTGPVGGLSTMFCTRMEKVRTRKSHPS